MNIPKATLSGKKQITVPAEVCRKMKLKIKGKVYFIEIRPGEFQLASAPPVPAKSWAKGMVGKYPNDNIDAVQSLLNDRREEIKHEE